MSASPRSLIGCLPRLALFLRHGGREFAQLEPQAHVELAHGADGVFGVAVQTAARRVGYLALDHVHPERATLDDDASIDRLDGQLEQARHLLRADRGQPLDVLAHPVLLASEDANEVAEDGAAGLLDFLGELQLAQHPLRSSRSSVR
jgi:hypothetical protein